MAVPNPTAGVLPPQLSAVRSPIPLRITATEIISTATTASFAIKFLSATSTGQSVLFALGIGEVEMTCGILAQDGIKYKSGATAAQAAAFFADGCRENWLLTTHYIISVAAVTVTFTARNPGSVYSCSSVTPSVAGFMSVASNTGGTDGTPTPNYAIVARLWVANDSLVFNPVAELQGNPNSAGTVDFDISEVLRGAWKRFPGLDLEPDWPSPLTVDSYIHTRSFRPYYLEYWERSGAVPTEHGVVRIGSESAPLFAWLAGWNRFHYFPFRAVVDQITNVNGAPHPFLTYRGRQGRRFVTKDEIVFLPWYHWPMLATPVKYSMEARLTHMLPNGTSVATTNWTEIYTVDRVPDAPRGRIISLAAGYDQLELDSLLPAGRVPYSYEVRFSDVASATGPKSEELTFYIATNDHNEVFLNFWSSLGGVESVRATGEWITSRASAHEQLRKELLVDDYSWSERGSERAEPLPGQQWLKVVISSQNAHEHKCILDILGAPSIMLIDSSIGAARYRPVRIVESHEPPIEQRGNENEHVRILELTLAVDDASALTNLYLPSSVMVHYEHDDYTEAPPDPE